MEQAAKDIAALGAKAVLVKGGHRVEDATDILYDGEGFYYFKGRRVESTSTHGTGCSLSSAIASNLANGMHLADAVAAAKQYVFDGISHAEPIGKGHGLSIISTACTARPACSFCVQVIPRQPLGFSGI